MNRLITLVANCALSDGLECHSFVISQSQSRGPKHSHITNLRTEKKLYFALVLIPLSRSFLVTS